MSEVAILGGGLAGLSLALQLKQSEPGLEICVLEKASFPVPEAAHKVGESTVELAAHYFGHTLGLQQHLQEEQLPKFGLRFFFGQGDIDQRLELGGSYFPPTPSYQLDRGRFENFLAQQCQAQGIEVITGAKVEDFQLGESGHPHTVSYLCGTKKETLQVKWLVDASGRASLLKRKLNLKKASPHKGSAVWFRVNDTIHIDDWSQDPDWRQGHSGSKARWYSTNHLMGTGYWVWLIPLASGSTSIGIVVDESLHPVSSIGTLDKALDWLTRHEPQCAEKILSSKDKIQDFGILRNYSQDCERVFSSKRWFLTGEAGVFLDPFYSPGSDFIALSNTFITQLITEERAGKDVRSKTRFFNNLYLSFFHNTLDIFQDLYPIFGHPQVMSLKVVWDLAVYWVLLAYLSIQGRLKDPLELQALSEEVNRAGQINRRMQEAFRRAGRLLPVSEASGRIDFFSVAFLRELNEKLTESADPDQFAQSLAHNTARLEALAAEMLLGLGQSPQDLTPSQELRDFFQRIGLQRPAQVQGVS